MTRHGGLKCDDRLDTEQIVLLFVGETEGWSSLFEYVYYVLSVMPDRHRYMCLLHYYFDILWSWKSKCQTCMQGVLLIVLTIEGTMYLAHIYLSIIFRIIVCSCGCSRQSIYSRGCTLIKEAACLYSRDHHLIYYQYAYLRGKAHPHWVLRFSLLTTRQLGSCVCQSHVKNQYMTGMYDELYIDIHVMIMS